MGDRLHRWVMAAALLAGAAPVGAVSPGMSDTFQGGVIGGWNSGANSVSPAVVVASGGPAGAADGYLLLSSLGGVGASSRLVGIAGPQWMGDYLGAGIDAISLDVNNLGGTEVDLRVLLLGPAGVVALSTSALVLPAGSGWMHASLSLQPAALTGAGAAALADVQQLRLFHSLTATFPGDAQAASLGLDNITAVASVVPEPQAAWLLLPGLLAIGALRRRRADV